MFQGGGQFLLNYNSGSDPATNQAAVAYAFRSSDNTPEDQSFQWTYYVQQSGGATSPTAAVLIEVSPDNVTWIPLNTVSVNGTTTTGQGSNASVGWKYARASLAVAGGTAPAVIARVYIGWSGQCSASAV